MVEIEKQLSEGWMELVEGSIKPVVTNPLVVRAFERVDRKKFVPLGREAEAYINGIIPFTGEGSSLSLPSLMAVMLDLLELSGKEAVLEIGTGVGYNAALLSCCAAEVHTVEYNLRLVDRARQRLEAQGYNNVFVYAGDGARGVPEKSPFDRIILTAAVSEFPQLLFDQIKDEGIIVGPVGKTADTLHLAVGRKEGNTLKVQYSDSVAFILLDTPEHGGWRAEALAKQRIYTLEEAEEKIPYPRPAVDSSFEERPLLSLLALEMDDTADVGNTEPNLDCLEVLARYGLTVEEYEERFRKMGLSQKDVTVLLSSPHPEPFEMIVRMVFKKWV